MDRVSVLRSFKSGLQEEIWLISTFVAYVSNIGSGTAALRDIEAKLVGATHGLRDSLQIVHGAVTCLTMSIVLKAARNLADPPRVAKGM